MALTYLDGKRLKKAIIASARWIEAQRAHLNKINVFPVADGDTGTNIWLTMQSAKDAMVNVPHNSLPAVLSALSDSILMGARGNSGVILSQYFNGFAEKVGNRLKLNSIEIAEAMKYAAQKAYNAIEMPKEGTILTVINKTADFAEKIAKTKQDIIEMLEALLEESVRVLHETKDLLPALKKANVVDAGGLGFVHIIEGILNLIKKGENFEIQESLKEEISTPVNVDATEVGEFRYCTEVIIEHSDISADEARETFIEYGNSLIVVTTKEFLKIHVHSNNPEEVIEVAELHGKLVKKKVEDMQAQHEHFVEINS
jgi:DAK2 domain fusion protein YloV